MLNLLLGICQGLSAGKQESREQQLYCKAINIWFSMQISTFGCWHWN